MRATLMLITLGCASALPRVTREMRDNMQDAMIADGLDNGKFKDHPEARAHSKFTMANISMLQLEQHLPGLKEYGDMRFEPIESGLNAIEMKIEKLLGGGYQHGHLVLEGNHKSHSVRAMVPRDKKSLDHALMLERGWFDWWDDVVEFVAPIVETIVEAVVEVATVIVDVIVEVVTVVVDAVVDAVKAVASAIASVFNGFMDLLKAIAVAIMKAAIGCDDCVDRAMEVMSVSPADILVKMIEWIKDYVLERIEKGFDLERSLEKDVEMERERANLASWIKKKNKCYKDLYKHEEEKINEEKAKCEERLAKTSFKGLERSLERMSSLEREQEYADFFSSTTNCRKTSKALFDTLKLRFKKHLYEDPSICEGLPWPKPKGFSTNLRQRALERIESEALERSQQAEQSKSFEILDPHAPALERRGAAGVTIAALFQPVRPYLQGFIKAVDYAISGTESQQSSNCGCDPCPCKPVACFSFILEASAAVKVVSISAGGELGYCVAADGSDTAFIALGGGLSFGVGFTPLDASGGLQVTAFRNMGDVAGHALSCGFSVGDYGLAALWAVNGDADWKSDEGKKAEGWLDELMATAFVGVAVSKTIKTKDIITAATVGEKLGDKWKTRDGVGSKKLGLSVDFGYAYGWQLDSSFNGNDASTEVTTTATKTSMSCQDTCKVDEGVRGHRCSNDGDCQGWQRTCSPWGWCQGGNYGNDCCTSGGVAYPGVACYDGPCKSCKINCA